MLAGPGRVIIHQLLEGGGSARITGASGSEIVVENAGEAAAGNSVVFAIRPEKIKVSSQRPEGVSNAMEGEVFDLAYLGDMTVYHVKLPDGQVVKASALNAAARARVEEFKAWLDGNDVVRVFFGGEFRAEAGWKAAGIVASQEQSDLSPATTYFRAKRTSHHLDRLTRKHFVRRLNAVDTRQKLDGYLIQLGKLC